jgi:glycosyltransferase involved in cell wall biosynthesis
MPRVSVVIPVYNREGLISRAIDSVLAQDSSDFELLCIDDGSTDGTAEVLDSYGSKISAIYQDNAGRSAARNRGIELAKGEFVAFLDSDDTWSPTKLSAQLCWHDAHPEAALSAHGIEIVHGDGHIARQQPRCSREQLARSPYEAVMDHFAFFPSVVMVRRLEALDIGGFTTDYDGAEDLDFALKIALQSPLGVFDDCLTRMYQHDGQTGKKQLATENVRVLKAHLELFSDCFDEALKLKLRRKMARYKISMAKRSADRGECRQLLREAVELDAGLRLKGSYLKLKLKSLFLRA